MMFAAVITSVTSPNVCMSVSMKSDAANALGWEERSCGTVGLRCMEESNGGRLESPLK